MRFGIYGLFTCRDRCCGWVSFEPGFAFWFDNFFRHVRLVSFSAGMSLNEVIGIVSSTKNFYYPVVDDDNRLVGAITLDGIRNTFTMQGLNDWLIALDIVEDVIGKVTPQTALSKALSQTKKLDIEYVPVTESAESKVFVGVLDCHAVRRSLSAEVLSRQKKADSMSKN